MAWIRRASRGLLVRPSSCADVRGTSPSFLMVADSAGLEDGSEGGGVAGWPLVVAMMGANPVLLGLLSPRSVVQTTR